MVGNQFKFTITDEKTIAVCARVSAALVIGIGMYTFILFNLLKYYFRYVMNNGCSVLLRSDVENCHSNKIKYRGIELSGRQEIFGTERPFSVTSSDIQKWISTALFVVSLFAFSIIDFYIQSTVVIQTTRPTRPAMERN